jgi:hypothetical protein
MSDIVIVQSIKSVWTKNSRGGRLATLRSAVPEALALPFRGGSPQAAFILHEVVYHESNNFSKPLTDSLKTVQSLSLEVGCVTIERNEESVVVKYEHGLRCGAPVRFGEGGQEALKKFALGAGETGRVAYNGRFSGDHWWYEKIIVNVCRCAEVSNDILTHSMPAPEIMDLAILW